MSELAKKRASRDLWVSRGQLAAALVVAGLLCVLSFVGGVRYGRSAALEAVGDTPTVRGEKGDLLDVIARVEANAEPDGGVRRLTFPDALAGGNAGGIEPPSGGVVGPGGVSVPSIPGNAPPNVGSLPSGAVLIEVARFPDIESAAGLMKQLDAAGVPVRLQIVSVGGQQSHILSLDGFASEADAQAALEQWADPLAGLKTEIRPANP